MKSIKPPKLKEGDTIGIISPSYPITKEFLDQFNSGIKSLEALGLKVKCGKNIFNKFYYSAGQREERLSDIHTLWEDDDVKAIIMSIGGTSCLQLLDGLDYDLIASHPKIFAGISDGTILLNAIYARTNLVTYHGPDVIFTFGAPISPIIKENIIKTLFSGQVGRLYPNPDWAYSENKDLTYNGWKWLRKGKASGKLVGGHSNSLTNLILSGYGPEFKEKILILEGTDPLGRLDRQLSSLRLKGIFEEINGMILGWFEGSDLMEEGMNRPVGDVVLEITEDYDFPILEIGELGHNVENYVFPIGCQATLDSEQNLLMINEKTVS